MMMLRQLASDMAQFETNLDALYKMKSKRVSIPE